MTRQAPVVAVFGRRGTGKTTLAMRLVRPAARVVVFDPIGEWAMLPEFVGARDLASVRRTLAALWRSGFHLAYVPPCLDPPAELAALANLLWRCGDVTPPRPLTLVVDEAQASLPVHRGLRHAATSRLVFQGRHRALGLLTICQRPASLSADVRGQLSELYCFALPFGLDRRAVGQIIGDEHAESTAHLPVGQCLRWRADGRVTRVATKP